VRWILNETYKICAQIHSRLSNIHQPFHRSFEGHFEDHGLRAEFRFYISERFINGRKWFCRYSPSPHQQIYQAHSCAGWNSKENSPGTGKIRFASKAIAGSRLVLPKRNPLREEYFGQLGGIAYGIIQPIIKELQSEFQHPGNWDPDLPLTQSLHNAAVRLCVSNWELLMEFDRRRS